MSLVTQQWEFLQDVAKLISYAQTLDVVLTGGELYRTEDQQQLYFAGETVEIVDSEAMLKKIKPKSKTMKSNHLERLAIDFNFFVNGELVYDATHPKLVAMGKFWESLDKQNSWGGFWNSFKDTPHFEKREV